MNKDKAIVYIVLSLVLPITILCFVHISRVTVLHNKLSQVDGEREAVSQNIECRKNECECDCSSQCNLEERCPEFLEENGKKNDDSLVLNDEFKNKFGMSDNDKDIIKYSFSPDGREIYWSDSNAIWKKDISGEIKKLVSAKEFDIEKMKERWKSFGSENLEGINNLSKGITDFELSPDGEYIFYEEVGDYAGCCASPPNIPVPWAWLMKSDGTGRARIEAPKGVDRNTVVFDRWFPDSQKIVFHSVYIDDDYLSGSPLFIVGLDGKNPQLFTPAYQEDNYPKANDKVSIAVGTGPIFSPNGDKMVYIKNLEEIWIANIDGTEKRMVLGADRLGVMAYMNAVIEWGETGGFLSVKISDKRYIFDSKGNMIFESK